MPDKITLRKNFILNTAYIALVIVLGILAVLSANIIMPFWFALLIAALLQPAIRALNKKVGHKKIWSVIILMLFYLIIGGAIVCAVVEIAYLMKEFFDMFPQYFRETIQPNLANIESILTIIPEPFRPQSTQLNLMETLQNAVASFSQQGVKLIGGFLDSVSSSFVGILITIMLSYFVIVQYDAVIAFLKCQLPERFSGYADSLKNLLKNSVLKYIKAAGILMANTFVELSVGLLIIGAENPIWMAACIAIFDALPVFGVGGIMLPWAVFELLEANYTFAVGVLIIYGVVILVRNVLEPKVLGEQLGLNPIVALVSIYAGYKLIGILGMISFPIIAYVLLSLHKDGKLRLYKESVPQTETNLMISEETKSESKTN